MVKVRFTLDDATVAEHAARAERPSGREQLRTVGLLEKLQTTTPSRRAADVDAGRRALRAARKSGGRRSAR